MSVLSYLSYDQVPAFILAIGALTYIGAIFCGAKPLVGTWVTYTLLTGLTAYGMHGREALTPLVATATGFNVIILILALRHGEWQWGTVDKWCFGVAAIGGCASLVAENPNIAIATGVLANTAAAIPTAIKGFIRPASEPAHAYAIFIIASGFAAMQMPSWAFEYSFQPVMWLVNGVVTFMAINRSRPTLYYWVRKYREWVPKQRKPTPAT